MFTPTRPDSWDDAKRLTLAIIQESGGAFRGKTRLFKAFYDAHVFYWKQTGQYLTTYPIVRMPQGPGIDQETDLLEELECEERLAIKIVDDGPYAETSYRLTGTHEIELGAEEKEAIHHALDWIKHKSATQVSEESHKRSRTWREAIDGQELHVCLDAMTDEEYERMRDSIRMTQKLLHNDQPAA